MTLTLSVLGEFAVSKLESGTPVPVWATSSDWWSVTTTSDELSIVCPENKVPRDISSNRGWKCLKVIGPLQFSLTGILCSLLKPLAERASASSRYQLLTPTIY